MADINELLEELHSQFPELEEGVAGAVAGSLGKSAAQGAYNLATKVPIVGGLIKGVGTALGQQPAQPGQPASAPAPAAVQPKGKGILYGVGNAIGNAINAGRQAGQANTAPAGGEDMSSMENAPSNGLEGFEVSIDDAFKAIQAFANDPSLASKAAPTKPAAPTAAEPNQQAPKQESIHNYDQLLEEISKIYEGAPAQGNEAQQDPDIAKLQKIAANFCKQAKDFNTLKGNENLLNVMVKFVQELGVKGITIKGLDVDPKQLQAAIAQEKQNSGNAEQQVVNLPDDQLAQVINNMDRRALAGMVRQAVKSDPAIASQLLKSAPQQQQAGGRRLPQQAAAPAQADATTTTT